MRLLWYCMYVSTQVSMPSLQKKWIYNIRKQTTLLERPTLLVGWLVIWVQPQRGLPILQWGSQIFYGEDPRATLLSPLVLVGTHGK